MHYYAKIKICLVITCLSLMLGGCSISRPSKNSDTYVLNSRTMPGLVQTQSGLAFVVVGPVTFADYLKRSSIVSRQQTMAKQAKFDVWAGALDDEFQIALVKNLSAYEANKVFVRYPTQVKSADSLRLVVDVMQFDSSSDGVARIEAVWGWLSSEGELLSGGNYANQAESGASATQITEALSQLVDEFSLFLAKQMPQG